MSIFNTPPAGSRAIIIGGSIAGLLTARVLSEHVAEVIVIEKDPLTDKPEPRRGVPQSTQLHSIHQKGAEIMQSLFPDMAWDYDTCGVVPCDLGSDMRWFFYGEWMKQASSDVFVYWCERPRLEWQIRRRVLDRPNVHIIDQCKVTALNTTGPNGRINGVTVRTAEQPKTDQTLYAHLVIDACGRGSRLPQWLTDLGYPSVPQSEVKINLGYASGYFQLPEGVNPSWKALLISAKPGLSEKLGLIYRLPNNQVKVLLAGWFGDHPPTDLEGFLDFAYSLPQLDLYGYLRTATPISPIRGYKLPSNKWQHFEKMDRWPDSLYVIGDSICSFNPSFGQGMTVAALQAVALGEHLAQLARQNKPLTQSGVARRFQKDAARIVNNPWMITTGEDLRFPKADGPRPWSLSVIQGYLAQVFDLAHENTAVAKHFFEVMTFLDEPPSLFRPRVLWPVIRHVVGKLAPKRVRQPAPQPQQKTLGV